VPLSQKFIVSTTLTKKAMAASFVLYFTAIFDYYFTSQFSQFIQTPELLKGEVVSS